MIVGFALFGSVTYFPVYLQVVKGVSPTASGMQMLPMMAGMLTTSIISGQLISRWGRYKMFPVAGTAVMTVGLYLLSHMGAATTALAASSMMLVPGLGLGMVMQVLVIAVQNAVDDRDLGVATSGATLFRLVGGFAGRMQQVMGSLNAATLAQLPPALRAAITAAFMGALDKIFLVASWRSRRRRRGCSSASSGTPTIRPSQPPVRAEFRSPAREPRWRKWETVD